MQTFMYLICFCSRCQTLWLDCCHRNPWSIAERWFCPSPLWSPPQVGLVALKSTTWFNHVFSKHRTNYRNHSNHEEKQTTHSVLVLHGPVLCSQVSSTLDCELNDSSVFTKGVDCMAGEEAWIFPDCRHDLVDKTLMTLNSRKYCKRRDVRTIVQVLKNCFIAVFKCV